jgi:3-methylcrotonyl-CoA carboxylase alpha subunit
MVSVPILVDGELTTAQAAYGPAGAVVTVDGVEPALDATAIVDADAVYVLRQGRQTVVRPVGIGAGAFDHADGDGQIRAPMHGKILAVLVAEGDRVEQGRRLAVIEAMKMEHVLIAPSAGRVVDVSVSVGAQVAEGTRLMTIEAIET